MLNPFSTQTFGIEDIITRAIETTLSRIEHVQTLTLHHATDGDAIRGESCRFLSRIIELDRVQNRVTGGQLENEFVAYGPFPVGIPSNLDRRVRLPVY